MMDINCDAGESYGRWTLGDEEAIFPYVTSVNIACGFHAGDPGQIYQTIKRALRFGLRIGAHPSYPDLVGFGRRSMPLSADELHALLLFQISAVKGMVEALGGKLTHVKPHGALYNDSAKNPEIAQVIAESIAQISSEIVLYGLADSVSLRVGRAAGLQVWSEVFADRSYELDGSLTPRHISGSVLSEEDSIRRQVRAFLAKSPIPTRTGDLILLSGDTLCLHSDSPDAERAARWIRQERDAYYATLQ